VDYYQKLGAKIAVSAEDGKELEFASEIVSPQHFREKFGEFPKKVKPDMILKEGDIISNDNFKLKVINCPGHTIGAIALFDEEKGILFSGDTWYGRGMIGTWKHIGGSFIELQKSVEKLKSLNVKIICSGHGAAKWKKKK
jgi:glyoxylase-like metal-dependent hydrolase (beta-lactamase superfamily II)